MKKNKLPYNPKNNFKVPEGYFETLEDRVMDSVASIEEEDLLEKKVNTGFKVPENYFENFETQLFDKIEKERKPSKVRSLFNKEAFYYVAGAAAVFVALITTVFTNPAQPFGFDDLDTVTLEGYLHENMDFSNSDAHYLNEGTVGTASSNQSEVDFEAIFEYLNENVEEPSLLLNEN